MEPITATAQALSSAAKLHAAVRALQEAVAATERNGHLMQDIARAVCVSAPMLRRLLTKAVLSSDENIDKAFTIAIDAVVDSMMHARSVVFSWLVKNRATRLMTAADMERALAAVHRSLVDNLGHISMLQVDDVYHKVSDIIEGVGQVNSKLDMVLQDVAKLQHGVADVQEGLADLQLTQKQATSQQAAIEVVVGQLQDLLQDRTGQGRAAVMAMAKASEKRASRSGQRLKGHSDWVKAVAWSPDGRTLATGSDDNTAVLWDGSTGQRLQVLKGHSNSVKAVAWSPDGRTLATGSFDKTAGLWDGSTAQQLHLLKGHNDTIVAVDWCPNGRTLATGSTDNTAVLWDVSTGQQLHVLKSHSGDVLAVAWSPNGRTLATGSADNKVVVWDGSTGQQLHVLNSHSDEVHAIAWSPNGRTLVTGSDDDTAVVWDGSTGQRLHVLSGRAADLVTDLTPWDSSVVLGDFEGTHKTYFDQLNRIMKGHHDDIHAVAWCPDGRTLVTGSYDHRAVLWNGGTGQAMQVFEGHNGFVLAVAWSPDGRTLATGSADNTTVLWDSSTGHQLKVLKGHSHYVLAVAFSPDGKTLATVSADNTVVLWDVGVKR